MKTVLLAATAAVAAFVAAPASAATYLVTSNGQTITTPPLVLQSLGAGTYSTGADDFFRTRPNTSSFTPNFTILYNFVVPTDGDGSISFTTTSRAPGTSVLRIDSATFNGAPVTITSTTGTGGSITYNGQLDFTNATAGDTYTLALNAFARRGGELVTSVSYATAAVPEPASWAMMIGGFGVVGGAARRRRTATTVSFA